VCPLSSELPAVVTRTWSRVQSASHLGNTVCACTRARRGRCCKRHVNQLTPTNREGDRSGDGESVSSSLAVCSYSTTKGQLRVLSADCDSAQRAAAALLRLPVRAASAALISCVRGQRLHEESRRQFVGEEQPGGLEAGLCLWHTHRLNVPDPRFRLSVRFTRQSPQPRAGCTCTGSRSEDRQTPGGGGWMEIAAARPRHLATRAACMSLHDTSLLVLLRRDSIGPKQDCGRKRASRAPSPALL
jgi:hypothetical protein